MIASMPSGLLVMVCENKPYISGTLFLCLLLFLKIRPLYFFLTTRKGLFSKMFSSSVFKCGLFRKASTLLQTQAPIIVLLHRVASSVSTFAR